MKKIVNGAFSLVESAVFEGATQKQVIFKAVFLLLAGGITYGFDSYRTNQKLADLDKRLAVAENTESTLRIAIAAHESRLTRQDSKIDKFEDQQHTKLEHVKKQNQMLLDKLQRHERRTRH